MFDGYKGGPLMNPLARIQVRERDYCTCDIRHPDKTRVCASCGKPIYWMETTMAIFNVECPECKGEGSCPTCNGSGVVVGVIGDEERAYTCGTCDGDGFCSLCSGSGEVEEDDGDGLSH